MHVCECTGERYQFTSQYYYGNYCYYSRFLLPQKNLASCIFDMKRAEEEDRISVRASIAKETGFTGLSILHRLYHLYGFNVLIDTVFDAMHNLPLNFGLHYMHYYFDEEIMSKQEVYQRLMTIPWTKGTINYFNFVYTLSIHISMLFCMHAICTLLI